jgi:hypothetical protein
MQSQSLTLALLRDGYKKAMEAIAIFFFRFLKYLK